MTWDREHSSRELLAAVKHYDRPRVAELCEQLIAHVRAEPDAYPLVPARTLLAALRAHRHFALVARVADALVGSGLDDPAVRRQHAQALIDEEQLVAAVAVLERLVADTAAGTTENAEARGLLGRAHKQMYVVTGPEAGTRRGAFLAQAVAAYGDVYSASRERRWHGINAAALLHRAARDGVELDGVPDPHAAGRAIAQEILDAIDELGDCDTWDHGTAMEACVALGRTEAALERLDAYLAAGPPPFAIAGTLRQLREVWGLDGAGEPGAHLIPVLQAALLDHEQGGTSIAVRAEDMAPPARERIEHDAGFEKVLGSERFESLKWFSTALERCRAIGRVENPLASPFGSGFLVEGRSLHPSLPAVVFVTNAHVVSEDPRALRAEDARVTFRALEGQADTYRIARVLWSSPVRELDATIVELDGRPGDTSLCPVAALRPRLDTDPPPQTYIIGHPGGADQIMLSVRDNQLLDGDDVHIHYRTPTLGGSSGSPVFDRSWQLIALHHSGREDMPRLNGRTGTYPANEGIWLDRIVRELLSVLGPSRP